MLRLFRSRSGLPAAAIAGLLAGGWQASALAAADDRRPLTVVEVSALEFGKVTSDAALGGTITVDPRSGRKSARGGAIELGGYHSPATFRVTGEPHARFVITLPHRIELSDEGGTVARMVLKEFRSDPSRIGTLSANGEAIVRVGAMLELPPASDGRRVRGDFVIFVDYEG